MRSPSAIGTEVIQQMQNIQIASFPTAFYPDGIIRFKGVPEGSLLANNLWQQGAANFSTIDRFMSGFADTITARIRNNRGFNNLDYAKGKIHINATCIRVRWAWVSFLGAAMILTICFLVVLIITQSRNGVTYQNWKSSSLAVLFCAVDQSIQQAITAKKSRDELFEVAETTRARLIEDPCNGTAKFVTAP